jgi:hypothetical protein
MASRGVVLCIIPGPTVEVKREPAGDLWCFGCRKRLPHEWVLMRDAEPSYYDPTWHRECSRCHKDRTYFPGCGPL